MTGCQEALAWPNHLELRETRLRSAYETFSVSRRFMLTVFAATSTHSLSTSCPKVTAHLGFWGNPRYHLGLENGPNEVSYFSSSCRKFRKGIWHASAMPRIALTWSALPSSASRASSRCKTCLRPFSSIIASCYSEEAPPALFNAVSTFFTRPLGCR